MKLDLPVRALQVLAAILPLLSTFVSIACSLREHGEDPSFAGDKISFRS